MCQHQYSDSHTISRNYIEVGILISQPNANNENVLTQTHAKFIIKYNNYRYFAKTDCRKFANFIFLKLKGIFRESLIGLFECSKSCI